MDYKTLADIDIALLFNILRVGTIFEQPSIDDRLNCLMTGYEKAFIQHAYASRHRGEGGGSALTFGNKHYCEAD